MSNLTHMRIKLKNVVLPYYITGYNLSSSMQIIVHRCHIKKIDASKTEHFMSYKL